MNPYEAQSILSPRIYKSLCFTFCHFYNFPSFFFLSFFLSFYFKVSGCPKMEDCEICDNYREHCYWNHRDLKGMQFYEVMNGDFSQQMRIPKKFSDHFRGELSDIVHLKSPTGKTWHIRLIKIGDEMLLQSGWKKFVKDHHLRDRDLLVFKYVGNSCFKTSIFNEAHCEKAVSYVFMDRNFETRETSEDFTETLNGTSHHKVIMCDSTSSSSDDTEPASPFLHDREISRNNRKSSVSFKRAGVSSNTRIIGGKNHFDHLKKNWDKSSNIGTQGTMDNIMEGSDDIHNHEMLNRPNIYKPDKIHVTDTEEKQTLQLVRGVKSSNPCFISYIRQLRIGSVRRLNIPARFVRDHLPSQNSPVFLEVHGQPVPQWCVSCVIGKRQSAFCGNWNSFARDNYLENGDVCLFELIPKPGDITMEVHIARVANTSLH